MPILDNHGPAWYKQYDPQGVEAFWLDLMLELVVFALVSSPAWLLMLILGGGQ